MPLQIAVVGASEPTAAEEAAATAVGEALAASGAVTVCGGLGGVMAAVCKGAQSLGGTTVGLLPGDDTADGNPWLDVVVPTGLGEARNALVVGSAASVIAIGGGYGTLSEIALALRAGKPVIGLGTWSMSRPGGEPDAGIVTVHTPDDAVSVALRLAAG